MDGDKAEVSTIVLMEFQSHKMKLWLHDGSFEGVISIADDLTMILGYFTYT